MTSIRPLAVAGLLLVAVAGCGTSARLVQGDRDGGVVAIPSNSNSWPNRYRDEADKLMAQKCPNGYDVVSEGEVVVGKTATSNESVDRRTPANKNGRIDQTTTTMTTSVSDKTEYRITFRAREVKPSQTVKQPELMQATAVVPADQPAPAERSALPSRPVPISR